MLTLGMDILTFLKKKSGMDGILTKKTSSEMHLDGAAHCNFLNTAPYMF